MDKLDYKGIALKGDFYLSVFSRDGKSFAEWADWDNKIILTVTGSDPTQARARMIETMIMYYPKKNGQLPDYATIKPAWQAPDILSLA